MKPEDEAILRNWVSLHGGPILKEFVYIADSRRSAQLSLQSFYDDLSSKYKVLSTEYEVLNSAKKLMARVYDFDQKQLQELRTPYEVLGAEHEALRASYIALSTKYVIASKERDFAIADTEEVRAVNRKLMTERDQALQKLQELRRVIPRDESKPAPISIMERMAALESWKKDVEEFEIVVFGPVSSGGFENEFVRR